MRVAVVGFPYAGKTALFTAITGVPRDHLNLTGENLAAVRVPEPRLDLLFDIYKPKRRHGAAIDFVDMPGSVECDVEHAGLAKHMPTLRECEMLLLVLRAFTAEAVPTHQGRVDPQDDLVQLRDEMLIADLEACANRIEKLQKAIAKPTQDRDQQKHELAVFERCREALENERPLSGVVQPGEEEKLLRSFGFLTQKPVVVVLNVNEENIAAEPPFRDEHAAATFAVCAALEADLIQMEPSERGEFMKEWGVQALARDRIVHACFKALGLITFLTGGSKEEVRAWAIPAGTTAVDAAGKVHTDMARGFIRAETVAYDDLHAAGDFRAAKAAGKVRQEPKHYVVQDGDVINFKFNV